MDTNEIKETDVWQLYQKGVNYCRLIGLYKDTDINYRMVYGNQWEGLKIESIEPVQFNILKRIVSHKCSILNNNLWKIVYSSENYDNPDFMDVANKSCELLTNMAAIVWEKENFDKKIRKLTNNGCINSESIIYLDYDKNSNYPVAELLQKNDVIYGNENDLDIQKQPYIIIKTRRPVSYVRDLALANNVNKEDIDKILGDNDTNEEAGSSAKLEANDMITLLTKLYKKEGKVCFSKSTKYVDIQKDGNSGLTLYPLEHFIWYETIGSARGEGIVKYLIPNQLELNKTIMRRLLTIKKIAYPSKVVKIDDIENPDSIDKIGATIKVNGSSTDDVRKAFTTTAAGQMSPDSKNVLNEIIDITNQLEDTSEAATGNINPEQASGKAILAVQEASQQPMTEQLQNLKSCIEGIARIFIDMWQAYAKDGLMIPYEIPSDAQNKGNRTQLVKIPTNVLDTLKATCKVDITPKSPYDRYAQELSIENLFKNGAINLEEYANALDNDSVMPKTKLLDIIKKRKEVQTRINNIDNQAQQLKNQQQMILNQQQNIDATAEQGNQVAAQAQQNINNQTAE